MAASECKTTHRWAHATIVTVCFHLVVLACLSDEYGVEAAVSVTISPPDSTGKPATKVVPSVEPADTVESPTLKPVTSRVTVGPPVTHRPTPTAGLLCGQYTTDDYDLKTLAQATYWTFNKAGACFDTYDESSIDCEFGVAFCKQIPPDLLDGKTGTGAYQVSSRAGSQNLRLGGLSQMEQNEDEKGVQLVARFLYGDEVACGRLQVELHLHCNPDAVWRTPSIGLPGKFPTATIAYLIDSECKYVIETNYAGACRMSKSLSAGTIVIIIFACLVVVYLVGGVIFNKFSGARGLELIPNYDMWRHFPGDVMNGAGFVIGVITCQGIPSKPQIYDEL